MRPWTQLKFDHRPYRARCDASPMWRGRRRRGRPLQARGARARRRNSLRHDQVRHAALRRQHLLHHRHEEGLVRRGRHQVRARALWAESQRFQRHDASAQRPARHHLGILSADAADLQGRDQAQVHRFHRQLPRQRHPRQSRAEAEVVQGLHRRGQELRGGAQARARPDGGQDAGRRAGAQRPSVRGISQQGVGGRLQAAGARRRQVARAGEGGPRGFRQSGGRADRLYA